MQIRTLIGHKEMPTGLICLKSLQKHNHDPFTLIVHDDGTLTEEDRTNLSKFTQLIISRKDADEIIEQRLKRFPNCLAYRRQHPHGLKLFDITLMSDSFLAYTDSDIFFQRPFIGLFKPSRCVFMQEKQNAYTLRPWHALRIRVPQGVNTGLILFQTDLFDLYYIESLLSMLQLQQIFERRPYWIEQTIWAALGWRIGCRLLDSRQFQIAHPKIKAEDAIAIHYVSTYRHLLANRQQQYFGETQTVRTAPMAHGSMFSLFMSDIKRLLNRTA
jgi:hypothetical protein